MERLRPVRGGRSGRSEFVRLRGTNTFVLGSALIAWSVGWAVGTTVAPSAAAVTDPLQVEQVVLDNGLTVMLSANPERSEVFGAVVVRTGGKNDPSDNTGMAHYLEHMLFKGTTSLGTLDWKAEQPLQAQLEQLYERLGSAQTDQERKAVQAQIGAVVEKTYAYAVPNELDQLLEELGGSGVNAFTTYDETVYYNTFPASQLGAWLSIYAHRFENPVFRLFPTELEAVYEEKNIAIDTTGYAMFRSFMKAAFPGHPYGHNDILGEVEHLRRPSLRVMREYFERYYVPQNMALVLSGDLDPQVVLPLVEAEFGRWAPGPDPRPPTPAVQPFEVEQRLRLRATPVRVGAVAYRTVPESHPDFAALQVARRLLSNEQRSGFIDRLSDDGKLLFAVHVPADLAEHNLDAVAYLPRLVTQSFRGAERLVTDQFQRIVDGDFSEATVEALKEGLIVEQTYQWEDNEDRALAMAHAFVAMGGWEGQLRYMQALRDLRRADIIRVAGELFGRRHLKMRSRVGFPRKPRLEKPSYPPVDPPRGRHSSFYSSVRGRPTEPPQISMVDPRAAIEGREWGAGVRVQANGNPFNDLYQLQLHFGVGQDAIRELDVLDDYLERIGTKGRSAVELRQRLFELSTTLTATTKLDRFIVELAGPPQHMQEALALLAELMREPRPERRPLRQIRREIWGFRRLARQDPPNVGRALRDYVLYGDHSPERRSYGAWGARGLSPRELLDAWRRVQTRAVEVRYVGNMALDGVIDAVQSTLPLGGERRPAKPKVVYKRNAPAQTTVYFVPRRDAVQTQLWFAVQSDPVARGDVPAADAFGEYFGGSMAGLVFQEVREFRALAYSAKARLIRDDTVEQRAQLLGYIGCQADKTFEALDVMIGLITQMPRRPERLEMVKGGLTRGLETASPSFRELSEEVDQWRARGYGEDPRRWLLPAYEALTFEDIIRFYTAYVSDRPLAIMVVGDPRVVKPAQLKRYGRFVHLREGQLYSL